MTQISSIEHVVVYRNENEFAGWPFNGGMWQFADGEIAVGFFRGPCDYQSEHCTAHSRVDVEHCIIRSTDGGQTWNADNITTIYPDRLAFAEKVIEARPSTAAEAGFDATADGYCLISGFGLPPGQAPHAAFVMISTDRGHTWTPPWRLPIGRARADGFRHVGGRPSYLVREDGVLLLFAHGSRDESEEQSRPIIYGSWDGGASFGIIGEIEPTPAHPMAIMPYPLMLQNGTILLACRRQYDGYSAYTQIYASDDGGRSWRFHSRPNDWGAPANLIQLEDGRIVCVYGYRQKPWGIRATVSEDDGKTWGPELILRDDGGSWDVGYPRTVLRPDGTLVTTYYFNSLNDNRTYDGGVRHIAATLWRI